jgi:Fic family protein
MRAEEFTSDSIGQLAPTIANGQHCLAFVPHPLPHRVQYGSRIAYALSEASGALGELAGLARQLPNPALLISPFMRREAVLSSRIEGTQTELADLYAYEAGQLILPGVDGGAPEEDRQEVANYVRALQYGLEALDRRPLSLRLIREVHSHLLDGARGRDKAPGELRRVQNWIGGGRNVQDAVFVPPPPPQMKAGMEQLEVYLNSEDPENPPLVRLAMVHYQFEALHPFLDGNGRVGRLLLVLMLVQWNLLPAPLLYLSGYLERHRSTYYELLLKVSQEGRLEDWIEFFLNGVAEQSKDARARARRLQDLQAEWRKLLTMQRTSSLALRLMDSLFESPVLTIVSAAECLGASYMGARKVIEKLLEAGIVREIGKENRRVFLAEGVLSAINTPVSV